MKKSKVTSIIIVVPLLAMAAGSVVFLIKIGRELKVTLPEVLKSALSERIDGSVRFGRIGVDSSGVSIHDIVIADASNKPVAEIPVATIEYSLSGLVRSDPIASIKVVDLREPRIFLERQADGQWNIEGLIKPLPPGKPLKFGGRIRVESGRLIVRDRLASLKQPMENAFSDLHASIDLSEMPVARYAVTGKGPAGRLGKFAARGSYNLAARSLNADLDVLNANASYWTKYPVNIGLEILSGRADATVKLSKPGKDRPLSYSSAVRLRDASIRFKPIRSPVKDLAGDVNVQNNKVSMKLKGRLESTPFFAAGDVRDFKHPTMSLDLTFDRIDLREVVGLTAWAPHFRQASIPRSGRLKAHVSGPPKSFAVDFALESPSLAYKGYGGRSVRASGKYFNRRIRIDKATATAYGGLIQARGDIDFTQSTKASFTGKATGLQATEVPFLKKEGLVSSSDGLFNISAEKGGIDLDYRGSMDGMRYGSLGFDGARIDCLYARGILLIRGFSAKTLGGSVAASGSIGRDGILDLQASGSDINLAEVLKGKQAAVGRAQFAGIITGNTKSPVFAGNVDAERVMISELGIERIAGKIHASHERISLDNLVFYDYPGSLTVSGIVTNPLAKVQGLDISIKADALDVSRLSAIDGQAGQETGMLFGDLTISGTSLHPKVAGDFHVQGASYQGTSLDSVLAKFTYGEEGFRLEDCQVGPADSLVTANGKLTKNGEISAEFQGEHVAMEKFSTLFKPYAAVSGNVSLKGSIAGKVTDPSAKIELASNGLVVNGQAFKDFSAKASFDKNALVLSDIGLSDGKAMYSIPELSYDFKSKIASASVHVTNGSAAQMLAMLDGSPAVKRSGKLARVPRPLSGIVTDITGTVKMGGGKAVPEAHATLALDDMQFGSVKIKSIRMEDCSVADDVVTIKHLEAIEGDTNVSVVEATLGPADALSINVDAHSLSMDTLRQWVKLPDNFSGKADVTVIAGGTRTSPTSKASVEIVDPVIAGAKFDRLSSILTAGEPAQNGQITVKNLTLTLDNHDLKVTGYVPVDWKKPAIPRDRPVSFKVDLDNDALAILSAFSKIGMGTSDQGKFEGSIELGGTIKSPGLSGSITWENGEMSLPKVQSPFQQISASMTFSGDKLTVDRFTGFSAEGGTFDISGDISFVDMKPTLDLGVKTEKLRISGKDFSDGYGESVKVVVDVKDARISENWRQPLISGNVSIDEGSVSIPSKAPNTHESRDRSIDPRFNLNVLLGRKVRLDTGTLKSPLIGSVAVRGSLSKPVINGSLDIGGGTITFPMRKFRILPGSTLVIQPGPTERPAVEVDLRAQTKLTVPTTFRQRERYTVTMVAQGPIDKLQSKFDCSPPGLSESQMVALITGQSQLQSILRGEGSASLGTGLSGLFSTAMMPTVFEPIEEAFKSSLGLEEFALEAGYREPLQLTIGEHLWDGFYVDYSTVLGARPDYADSMYELTLSYRFKHGIELDVQTDENRTYSIGVAGRLKF